MYMVLGKDDVLALPLRTSAPWDVIGPGDPKMFYLCILTLLLFQWQAACFRRVLPPRRCHTLQSTLLLAPFMAYLAFWKTDAPFLLHRCNTSHLPPRGSARLLFPFVKDGPVHSMLEEIRKKVLMHLYLAFAGFDQFSWWLPFRYFPVISVIQGDKALLKLTLQKVARTHCMSKWLPHH